MKNLLKAHENNFEGFLFYDIEVFAEDALVIFKDINGVTQRIFHNDFEGLREFIDGKVLVGYNNYHYDDHLLTAMVRKISVSKIKYWNDQIIQKDTYWVKADRSITTLDCFQQINVAKSSLKKVEANIGLSIDESAVDFNINRKLTSEELAETIKYCEHDVEATIAIFKLRWFSYFIPKLMVVSMLPKDLQKSALRWNTTTISAQLLTEGKPLVPWDAWNLGSLEETKEMLEIIPTEIQEMFRENTDIKKTVSRNHYDLGCIFKFSSGGLHGVNDNGRHEFNNVKLLDVTSLYPNILLKIGCLGNATQKFKELVDKRVEVKHTDTILSNALKIVINSVYGLLKNQYSKLYNPMGALSVCIYGQIILFDLCQRLYAAGYTLINVNTDGVAFVGQSDIDFMEVAEEWEADYGLKLELSEFDKWIQKDVNNYIAITKTGKIKVKGGDVNKFNDPVDFLTEPLGMNAGVNWSGTNTNGIIHRCLVNKILYNKDYTDTIIENLDKPILFQYILQAGNTYVGTVDEDGNFYQKVNRVFATKDGVTLKKVKSEGNPQYFPNAPENMFVYNGDLREFEDFKMIIDVDYYSRLAREKYEKLWT